MSLRSVTDNPVYVPPDERPPAGTCLLDRRLPQCHGVPGAERARGRLGRPDPADPAARDGARHRRGLRTTGPGIPGPRPPRPRAWSRCWAALVEDARAAAMPSLRFPRGGQRPARRRVLADLQRLSLDRPGPQSASTARWPCSPPGPARHCSPPDASPLPASGSAGDHPRDLSPLEASPRDLGARGVNWRPRWPGRRSPARARSAPAGDGGSPGRPSEPRTRRVTGPS